MNNNWLDRYLTIPLEYLLGEDPDDGSENDSVKAQMTRQLKLLVELTCFQEVLVGLSIACAEIAKEDDDLGAGSAALRWAQTADVLAMLANTSNWDKLHAYFAKTPDLNFLLDCLEEED